MPKQSRHVIDAMKYRLGGNIGLLLSQYAFLNKDPPFFIIIKNIVKIINSRNRLKISKNTPKEAL